MKTQLLRPKNKKDSTPSLLSIGSISNKIETKPNLNSNDFALKRARVLWADGIEFDIDLPLNL